MGRRVGRLDDHKFVVIQPGMLSEMYSSFTDSMSLNCPSRIPGARRSPEQKPRIVAISSKCMLSIISPRFGRDHGSSTIAAFRADTQVLEPLLGLIQPTIWCLLYGMMTMPDQRAFLHQFRRTFRCYSDSMALFELRQLRSLTSCL